MTEVIVIHSRNDVLFDPKIDTLESNKWLSAYFNNRGKTKKLIENYQSAIKNPEMIVLGIDCLLRAIEFKSPSESTKKFLAKETKSQATPTNFIFCCSLGKIRVANKFLESGLDIIIHSEVNSFSPLHYAASQDNLELSKKIVQNKGEINWKTINGWTPLHYACDHQFKRQISFLLNSGANPNLQTDDMNTALHIACNKGDLPTVFLLLRSGADRTIINNRSKTAFDLLKCKISTEFQGLDLPILLDIQSTILNHINQVFDIRHFLQAAAVSKKWQASIYALLSKELLQ